MELRSPIRLYWDLTPAPTVAPDYDRICPEIASSRALTLHLTDLGDSLTPETAAIINRLSVSPLVLSLTVSHIAFAEAFPLLSSGIKKLYVDIPTVEALNSLTANGINGISFRISRSNFMILPEIIAACLEFGSAELQLPMERLMSGEEPLCLSIAERGNLADRISKIPLREQLAITANDPFIWRSVNHEVPFPDGICQAANTMLAIVPNGDVFPCPAMPVMLGNLQHSTFKEIIASTLKKELRHKIIAQPSGCLSCKMLNDCRGGCRGRSFAAAESFDASDPGCAM